MGHARRSFKTFNPDQLASIIGAMLDPGHSGTVVTGAGISSLADAFGGPPATQGTDANRPPRTTASNGVTVMQGVNDRLVLPATSATNQLTKWWWAAHILLDDVTTAKFLMRYGPTASFDPAATDSHNLRILGDESLFLQVFTNAAGTAARSASGGAAFFNNTSYVFATCEINLDLVGEANQVCMTADAVVKSVTFANSVGAPGAMPAALQGQPAGSDITIWSEVVAGFGDFVGKSGRWYIGKGAEPGVTQGCLTPATRANLALFDRPV